MIRPIATLEVFEKGALRSKTIQGILIALLGYALRKLGYDLPVELIQLTINDLLQILGLAWATWGRIKAETRIRGLL